METLSSSATSFLQGKTKPTINIGFDPITLVLALAGLLIVNILTGYIVKQL